jgi:sec-independent protein translocase protein TatC
MTRRRELPGARGDEPKPFLEHLEDLRRTLVSCALVLAVTVGIGFAFAPQILGLLTAPLSDVVDDPEKYLRSLKVAGAFTLALKVGSWAGLLLGTPALLYFIGQFIFPGLTDREKSVTMKALGFAAVLFVLGVGLGYFVSLPLGLRMMLGIHDWMGVEPEWYVDYYVAFAVQMLLGFGLAFELPVVVLVLGKLGIVTIEQLRSKRRHVVVVCLVLGMLLTPQDVSSQLVLAVPLYLLYELCIVILRVSERREAEA